ncbi:MFS transporter [Sphingoaurantiacus capsulatus]|uniref:MFS transporter n=1 Tax=Sphingoaurantiacus capsulatus TaxID=1771310 RepID=A0ABV7X8L6_9SPHN
MTPAVRMTLYNVVYFAGLAGVLLFLPVWFEKSRDLSGAEIGIIMACAGFGRMIAGPLAAAWADGRRDRHAPLKLLGLVVTLAFLALGFAPSFTTILAAALVGITGYWLIVGYIESGLMRLCDPLSGLHYSRARGLGSAAFVAGSLGLGFAIDAFGPPSALTTVVILCALLAAGAWLLAPEAVERGDGPPISARLREGLGLVKQPAFFLLIFGAGFVQASHAFYNVFGGLVWLNQGISGSWVGGLYSIGVAVEVAFLILLGRWSERFHASWLVIAGGLGALVRWIILSQQPELMWLIPLQALHGLSFAATYLGTMRLIQQWYGVDRAPTAQMMYQSFAAAPEAALASLLAGPLYDSFGVLGYLGMVVLAFVGLLLSLRLRTTPPPVVT